MLLRENEAAENVPASLVLRKIYVNSVCGYQASVLPVDDGHQLSCDVQSLDAFLERIRAFTRHIGVPDV